MTSLYVEVRKVKLCAALKLRLLIRQLTLSFLRPTGLHVDACEQV